MPQPRFSASHVSCTQRQCQCHATDGIANDAHYRNREITSSCFLAQGKQGQVRVVGYMGVLAHLPKFAPELFQNLKIANRRNLKSPKSQIAEIANRRNLKSPKSLIASLRSLRYISVTESQGCFAILENIPFSVERTQGNLIAIFQKKLYNKRCR